MQYIDNQSYMLLLGRVKNSKKKLKELIPLNSIDEP